MAPVLPPEARDQVIDAVWPPSGLRPRTEPGDNLRQVLSANPGLARHTTLLLHRSSFHTWPGDRRLGGTRRRALEHWPALFPDVRELSLFDPFPSPSVISVPSLVETLLGAPASLRTLDLGGVNMGTSTFLTISGPGPSTHSEDKRRRSSPYLLHLIAQFDAIPYIRGDPGVNRPTISCLLDTFVNAGIVPPETLMTLNMPQYWNVGHRWKAFNYTFPSLERFGVGFSHPRHLDLAVDDGRHLNTRKLLEKTSTGRGPPLAATLGDHTRYPAFRRVRVHALLPVAFSDTSNNSLFDAPREICARLFSPFTGTGVDVAVDADWMIGEDDDEDGFAEDDEDRSYEDDFEGGSEEIESESEEEA
ncbi:uncharacterized protein BXZ73DRAFT_99185 [Epithele typhae]|uniref:uncharacterized protein n=1 Tax=Epithele typhae TaxID=378194 RepID=UPI002007300E|nr:uncharacterized protein BXZ73DRAFT_99185 [Epithele typhae]KAH9940189.1 hypothetical protein BXZ73DRAFT_99185 [Epithele typhae]